jgi:outer membrane murein-binding lipoprotein Lpp
MKKIFTLIAVAALAVAMVACGNNAKKVEDAAAEVEVIEAEVIEAAPVDSVAVDSVALEAAAPVAE